MHVTSGERPVGIEGVEPELQCSVISSARCIAQMSCVRAVRRTLRAVVLLYGP